MTDLRVLGLFLNAELMEQREPVAAYVEAGGDLSSLGEYERELLAKMIRGEHLRDGKHPLNLTEAKRNNHICALVALAQGSGLPAYYDGSPCNKPEACAIVAKEYGLSRSQVKRIWKNRKPYILLKPMHKLGQALAEETGKPYPFQ